MNTNPVNETEDTRCNRSITARLMQADDELKGYYSELKNELMSYSGVRCSVAWKQEMYKRGWNHFAKILIKGKTLCLFLNLDAKKYEGTTYKVEDVSDKSINAGTPMMFRIKNERRLRLAKELIGDCALKLGLERGERQNVDYREKLVYKSDEELVALGLAKYTAQTEYDNIMKKD